MTANGQAIPVQIQPISNGYGDNTLVWEPQQLAFPAGSVDLTYQVTVGNIIIDGIVEQFSYQVRVFDPAIELPGDTLALADDHEPNDTFATATDVGTSDGASSELTIHVPGDRDFYRWSPSIGGVITVGSVPSVSGAQLRLGLYNDHQNLLKEVQGNAGRLSLSVQATSGDSFFLVVQGDSRNLIPEYELMFGHAVQPEARDDRCATDHDKPVVVNVTMNDVSMNGSIVPGSVRIVSPPAHGTALVDAKNGTVTYLPQQGFTGFDQARYVVDDSRGNTSIPATISITVFDMASRAWQNPTTPLDVNGDGYITPLDALAVINHINAQGSGVLHIDVAAGLFPPMYLDPTGDNFVTPRDALTIINFMHRPTAQEREDQVESFPDVRQQVFADFEATMLVETGGANLDASRPKPSL